MTHATPGRAEAPLSPRGPLQAPTAAPREQTSTFGAATCGRPEARPVPAEEGLDELLPQLLSPRRVRRSPAHRGPGESPGQHGPGDPGGKVRIVRRDAATRLTQHPRRPARPSQRRRVPARTSGCSPESRSTMFRIGNPARQVRGRRPGRAGSRLPRSRWRPPLLLDLRHGRAQVLDGIRRACHLRHVLEQLIDRGDSSEFPEAAAVVLRRDLVAAGPAVGQRREKAPSS